MKKKIFPLLLIAVSPFSMAQIGVNTTVPAATLDVTAKTKDGSKAEGILAPRLTGDELKAADDQYTTTQKGALVYVTSAATTTTTKTGNVVAEGYYYYDGNIWQKLDIAKAPGGLDVNIYNNDGTLAGNRSVKMGDKTLNFTSSASTGSSHFNVDGSTLNVNAVDNRVGIGTLTPARTLQVNGDGNNPVVRVGNMISQPSTGSYFRLTVDDNGDLYKSSQVSAPFYYQVYNLNNVQQDWISNFDTKVPSNKYTMVMVGNSFNSLLAVANGSYPPGFSYSGPSNVAAFQSGGTWRLSADYSQASTNGGVNGNWTIYTLIIDNSQVNTKPALTFNLGGSSTGSAGASPVP
nr:hypothetical protein [uncultured Chryseobacterium sp.]